VLFELNFEHRKRKYDFAKRHMGETKLDKNDFFPSISSKTIDFG
jgi:hypothetical protein